MQLLWAVNHQKNCCMKKAIELSLKISKDILKDWADELFGYNLHNIFQSVYSGPEKIADKNRIVCYIIHSYDPDSGWLDLRKDRIENKQKILYNLEADIKSDLYKGIIENRNEPVNIAIFNFLEELKDWRWRSVFDFLEYAAKMSRFASVQTEDEKNYEKTTKDGQIEKYKEEVDISIITKVNKEKGVLLDQSLEARKKANDLLEQIKKDFVTTDNAVQQDFSFSFSETAKKKDIMSWRQFRLDAKEKAELR